MVMVLVMVSARARVCVCVCVCVFSMCDYLFSTCRRVEVFLFVFFLRKFYFYARDINIDSVIQFLPILSNQTLSLQTSPFVHTDFTLADVPTDFVPRYFISLKMPQ